MAKLTAVADPEDDQAETPAVDPADDWEDPERQAERDAHAPEAPTEAPAADAEPVKKTRPRRGKPTDPKYLEPIPIPFDPLGIELDDGLSFQEWERLMHSLLSIDEGQYWWVGDVFAYGEDHFGEEAFQAFRAQPLKWEEKTIANRAWVSRHVPKKVRRPDLSWSHHREVAKLPPAQQVKILKRAADEGINCRDLKPIVRALLPDEETPGAAPQRTRVHAFEIHYSVDLEHAKHGLIVGEQAVALIKDALAERGVTLTNLSTNGFELAD